MLLRDACPPTYTIQYNVTNGVLDAAEYHTKEVVVSHKGDFDLLTSKQKITLQFFYLTSAAEP